ncbi:MAG: hypothetical protein KC414_12050, partial [Romboutsia sp.]|nr:hypothetical protein [Romboutsia sp.]
SIYNEVSCGLNDIEKNSLRKIFAPFLSMLSKILQYFSNLLHKGYGCYMKYFPNGKRSVWLYCLGVFSCACLSTIAIPFIYLMDVASKLQQADNIIKDAGIDINGHSKGDVFDVFLEDWLLTISCLEKWCDCKDIIDSCHSWQKIWLQAISINATNNYTGENVYQFSCGERLASKADYSLSLKVALYEFMDSVGMIDASMAEFKNFALLFYLVAVMVLGGCWCVYNATSGNSCNGLRQIGDAISALYNKINNTSDQNTTCELHDIAHCEISMNESSNKPILFMQKMYCEYNELKKKNEIKEKNSSKQGELMPLNVGCSI